MALISQMSTPTGQDTPKSLPPGQKATPATSRRCPPEAFLSEIEAKRYDFLAEQFREIDRPVLAQMCSRWAAEHRLTAAKLAQAEQRLAVLDATLYPIQGRAAE